MPTLRIATAGSVDDGKSTLIGRLLHDTKTVMEDQLAAVHRASARYGDGEVNLALLTDGLRAEREQGITIDVAHRYFATPARSFIVADTPGHAQYTRNMVTGASNADIAIVLVDARHGVVEQTRRHAFISALLGVHTIALAVNKMDLVDFDEGTFDRIAQGARRVRRRPADAGAGGRVPDQRAARRQRRRRLRRTCRGTRARRCWTWLEQVDVETDGLGATRLDVQRVIRPQGSDYRGYAGRLAGGRLAIGDAVTVLPSGRTSTISGPAALRTRGDLRVGRRGDHRRAVRRHRRRPWRRARARRRLQRRATSRRSNRHRVGRRPRLLDDRPPAAARLALVVQARHPRRAGVRRLDRVAPRPGDAGRSTTPTSWS